MRGYLDEDAEYVRGLGEDNDLWINTFHPVDYDLDAGPVNYFAEEELPQPIMGDVLRVEELWANENPGADRIMRCPMAKWQFHPTNCRPL